MIRFILLSMVVTIAGCSSISTSSSVSNIDWCLHATSAACRGGTPSIRLRIPSRWAAHQRWNPTQRWAQERTARVPNRLTGNDRRTAIAVQP